MYVYVYTDVCVCVHIHTYEVVDEKFCFEIEFVAYGWPNHPHRYMHVKFSKCMYVCMYVCM